MSRSETPPAAEAPSSSKKRKVDETELEIDINAPEPPSKKAQRKAKRKQPTENATASTGTSQAVKTDQDATKDSATTARSQHGIWIGNLTFTTTKDDLVRFFVRYIQSPSITENEISRINLPLNAPKFGKSQNRGFAYVDLISAEVHSKALELSETLLDGRRVLIKDARSFEGRPEKSVVSGGTEVAEGKTPGKRIFVGNLAFDTTADDLEKHFGVCGPVENVHMATFEDSGKCKGYAWIEFEQENAAQAAVRGWIETIPTTTSSTTQETSKGGIGGKKKIWVQKMSGRTLRMEFAEDKTTRYKKRFGKEAVDKKNVVDAAGNARGEDTIEDIKEIQPETQHTKSVSRPPKRTPPSKPESSADSKSRYSSETVQRIKGSIVEGKGQKVVFD